MLLSKLYENIDSNVIVERIQTNSKLCKDNDIFVCIKGATCDRHDFIDEAITNGAVAIVVSKDIKNKKVPIIKVDNIEEEYIRLCKILNNNPQDKLKIIGITGTDGKTSCATIIQTLLGSDTCGYVGTNGMYSKGIKRDNPNTTPPAELLYSFFNDFNKVGCKYVSLEASSEAFSSGRLRNLDFDISIFTNLSREHLNTHKTMENYLDAKLNLFRQTKNDGICILNKDDKYFQKIQDTCLSKVVTYGKEHDNDLVIKDYKLYNDHTDITFTYNKRDIKLVSPLLGEFNVYNLAASFLCALILNVPINDLLDKVKNLSIDGRMMMLDTNLDFYVMVDYAHTPNGIEKLLQFIKSLDYNKVITVIGQAGERDREKRPIVGQVVTKYSDYAIFTSEDPRSENPIDICNEIISNVNSNNYEVIIDRGLAIKNAILKAGKKDIVLILGKGNENYQKINDKKIYFNDIEEAYKAIKEVKNV